ncbi:UbiA family prenyltransferase [Pedosphaera parvula]|uniref:UbiA prenyltransferase n=1 Tax=Pedosphaera parvula (strain Ellin514) TaxID=320771 RepID=B9XLT1_PEDPL|nr:UbiA family prenyltransferase [Pedosphaera parvula]EEF59188.1 UbiA prenyltransferase [Pedosphaera parvula Ellin514]
MSSARTYLILGRTSNLPTVWSNCLAGWWLGGGGNLKKLPWLFLGATLLYLGGMYLNDAFDAEFDSRFRRERPIPSGAIPLKQVWQIGFGMLVVGIICLMLLGKVTGFLAIVLTLCILAYDAVHKLVTFSPVLMASCRFFLYLVAASVAVNGVTGWSVWCAFALAGYIVGLSYIARKESTRGALRYWPILFLALPIVLALLMNKGQYQTPALLFSGILGLWVMRSLRYTLWSPERNIGRTVSGLLAGIVWVDLLAVADVGRPFAGVFILLFLAALLFQRYVPAT